MCGGRCVAGSDGGSGKSKHCSPQGLIILCKESDWYWVLPSAAGRVSGCVRRGIVSVEQASWEDERAWKWPVRGW